MNLKTEYELKAIDRAVSSRFGIAHRVMSLPLTSHDFPYFLSYEHGSKNVMVGGSNNSGSSTGLNPEECYLSTVGEHLERYAMLFPPVDSRLQFGSYRSLLSRGLCASPPKDYALFSELQYQRPEFPFARFTEELEIDWVPADDVNRNRETWVPRAMTSWRMGNSSRQVSVATSNGAGAGFTRTRALTSAILELVERDSFCLHWWTKTALRAIDFSRTKRRDVQNWLEKFHPLSKFQFFLGRSELDLFPVFCIRRGNIQLGEPAFSINGACDPDPFVAVQKAFREGIQGLLGRRHNYWKPSQKSMDIDFDKEILNFKDGQLLFAHPENAHIPREVLIDPNDNVEIDDLPNRDMSPDESLAGILKTFRDNALDLYVVDKTTRDLDRLGIKVFKVISPELLELNSAHVQRRWSGRRLFEFRKKHGLSASDLTLTDLNPLPHPFP